MRLDGFRALLVSTVICMTGCTVGPDYVHPVVETPAAYKEANRSPDEVLVWKPAEPRDGAIPNDWWRVFDDPQLDALEAELNTSNENVVEAEARYRQALALIRSARAGYFPTLGASGGITRSKETPSTRASSIAVPETTDYQVVLDAAWEIDLWGRVRRTVEANEASATASAADLAAVRLSMQAALASSYFQLRATDTQISLLTSTVEAYAKSLDLTQKRYAQGVASKAEVRQAETQLKSTEAQAKDLEATRAQLEHATAVLVGRPPAQLDVATTRPLPAPPSIPVELPSALLERRPDIASAERRVAVANAEIGVATAAYYPALTLSGLFGFQGSSLSSLFNWPSRVWSVGAAAAETIFDGGLREAEVAASRANHEATVATYRQTVLTAFQEVEDNLVAARVLAEEAVVQGEAVAAARDALNLTTVRYKAGVVSYLDVVNSQTIALSNERSAVDIGARRFAAAVALIKALGGGWRIDELPDVGKR